MTLRSGNRCDSSLRTLRDCFVRPIYLRNRRVMPHKAPRKPEGAPRPINIPERRAHTIKCSHKDLAATLPHLGLEAGPAARTRLYVACRGTFPAAEAAPGCAHHICRGRWVKSIANAGSRWGNKYNIASVARQQALRITVLRHAQKLCEAHLPPEPASYAALGAS